ncbi:MAG TPA: SDR family NAD(P)-dependent oxidoreductase [bacterium]|nr:SDR family NAD(P)-dependent oxidoreductase [bacterium]
MFDLQNRIAVVTGASAGIGKATAEALASAGCNLILVARRLEKIEEFAQYLIEKYGVKCFCGKLDVRNRDDVERFFKNLPIDFAEVDILVNNAGLAKGMGPMHTNSVDDWEIMIDTNVKGLLYVSRAVVPGMVERDRGHIINIGSIAGRGTYPGGGVYCATKHAVNAITNGLRKDLTNTSIRVSTVDPAFTETEFSIVRFDGDPEKAKKVYEGFEPLLAEDIADAILYVATRPPHVTISDMVIYPTAQSDFHLVNRKN